MKSNKIYIAAAVCLLLGLLVFTGGFIMAGFNFKNISTSSLYMENSYVPGSVINDIKIDDSNTGIKVILSPDDKIHIKYFENEDDYYEITENNGILYMKKIYNRKWYKNFFNINFQKRDVILQVPSDYSGNIKIQTSNAAIDIKDIGCGNLVLTSSNARIETENIKMTNGNFKTSNGSISIKNVNIDGDMDCQTSNARIETDNLKGKNIEMDTSNGRISLDKTAFSGKISAVTSNGAISFKDLNVGTDFVCKTSNGSVKGNILGKITDFDITSRTSNGKNSLPESMKAGNKILDVKTSNGSIDIEFIN